MTSPLVTPARLLMVVCCLSLLMVSPALGGASKPKPKPKPKAEHIKLYNQAYDEIKDLEFASAQALLERALELEPDFAEAHNNLAYTLRKQGEDHFEKALQHYDRAIELDEKLAEAYMYRGVLHIQMGNRQAAEADLATLTEMDDDLAAELAYVIESGAEKTPEKFFGVADKQ